MEKVEIYKELKVTTKILSFNKFTTNVNQLKRCNFELLKELMS